MNHTESITNIIYNGIKIVNNIGQKQCHLCGHPCDYIGKKIGKSNQKEYFWFRCTNCFFTFVDNPDADSSQTYNDDYYAGLGADSRVEYKYELENPEKSVRKFEWQGILKIIGSLIHITPQIRWLDYGCGNGGLVRYVRNSSKCDTVGFEEGAIAEQAIKKGIPIMNRDKLLSMSGQFDIVTAIEVLEHIPNPLQILGEIYKLLKRPGLFFYTTANAKPFRDKILKWRYSVPEIHVSLYEPENMKQALIKTGFSVSYPGYVNGYTDVIRYKILKNLYIKRDYNVLRLLPWNILGKYADKQLGLTQFPTGLKK